MNYDQASLSLPNVGWGTAYRLASKGYVATQILSYLVHHLPGLAFLPFLTKRTAPTEAEYTQGVRSQADAPAQQRPVKPPYPAC
jgi:hypothetical protein